MKHLYKVLLAVILTSIGSLSLIHGQGAAKPINTKELITWNKQKIFLSGMNLAWVNFAQDLSRFNEEKFSSAIQDVRLAGGNTVRWWVFVNNASSPSIGPDGLVSTLEEEHLDNLKRGLDIAWENGIGINITLLSFDMLKSDQVSPLILEANKKILLDDKALEAFINKAVIPMVTALKNHPGIVAWEVFNEPEGMARNFGWTSNKVTMDAIQKVVNRVAGAIHREAPGSLVTNGSWNMQVLTDTNGMYNYYRDDRLIKAGGDKDGTLDFYSAHFYPEHFDDSTNPFAHPKSYWGLDKPLVIAEFPSRGIRKLKGKGFQPSKEMNTETAFRWLIENGYAGALSWTLTNHDGFGGIYQSTDAMAALVGEYPSLTMVNQDKLDRIPKLLKPIEASILSAKAGPWKDALDLGKHFTDEDISLGKTLAFSILKQSNKDFPAIITPDGKVSLQSRTPGRTGINDLVILVTDSKGNTLKTSVQLVIYDPDSGNVAFRKPVEASSVEGQDTPVRALNDGNLKTRFSTEYRDDVQFTLDLEGEFSIDTVRIVWEAAFGQSFDLHGSLDKKSWSLLAQQQAGVGGTDEFRINAAKVRYVRFTGIKRGTQWGYSPWEFEVYGNRIKN